MRIAILVVSLSSAACGPSANDVQSIRPHPEIDRAFDQDRSKWTPLHEATLAGDLPKVRKLIDAGADVAAENPGSNWTALDIAALYDKERILEYLVGVWRDQLDESPDLDHLLFEAAIHGNYHCARYLLEEGADPNYVSQHFEPLLHVAATHDHQETLAVLIEFGADVGATTTEGFTALHGAAEQGARGVSLMLEHGANPNARALNGYTALHVAADHGSAAAARVLVESGADSTAIAESGESPEDIALRHGYVDVISILRGDPFVEPGAATSGTMPAE